MYSFYPMSFGYESKRDVGIIIGLLIFVVILFCNLTLYRKIYAFGVNGKVALVALLCGIVMVVYVVIQRSNFGMSYSNIFILSNIIMAISGYLIPKLFLTNEQYKELHYIIDKQVE